MSQPDFAAMRDAMVESQLRTTGVGDARLLAAFAAVPREAFVPSEKAALAYADLTLPLGGGRELNLPMTTAQLLDRLALGPDDAVLVIGGAYAAAVAARLAARVVALEEEPALASAARAAIADSPKVALAEGPLREGWSAGAPYDAILIDGAVEHIPDGLVDQLAEGGRLAAAMIERGVTRLVAGRKQGGAFGAVAFAEAEAAPLPGFAKAREFVF